jgi:hypothetical protein
VSKLNVPQSERPNIELRVTVTDGSFDTKVAVPVGTSQSDVDRLIKAWFNLIEQAVAVVRKPAAARLDLHVRGPRATLKGEEP